MKKRIAIFTDVHGNLEALESIIGDIKRQDVDDIICLGDTIGFGPNSKECLDLIISNNIKMVLGNHELCCLKGTDIDEKIGFDLKKHYEWVKNSLSEKEISFLKKCPLYYECNIDYDEKKASKKIIFSHYLLKDLNDAFPFEREHLKNDVNLWIKYDEENIYYLLGHLHKSFDINKVDGISDCRIEETGNFPNIYIVDSCGCTDSDITSYTILEIGKGFSYKKIKLNYNRDKFVDKVKSIDFPNKEFISKEFFNIDL